MWRVFGGGPNCSLLRSVVSAILCLVLTFVAEGQEPPVIAATVHLKRGETLVLALLTPLDSSRAQVGDDVSLKLLLPLTVDGVNILPDGWPVHGRVSAVRPARRNCKPGKVVWKPNEITTPEGRKITISMDRREKESGRRIKKIGQSTALAPLVVLTLPFFAVLWVGMHNEGGCRGSLGEEERLPAGTALSAEVSNDILLPQIP